MSTTSGTPGDAAARRPGRRRGRRLLQISALGLAVLALWSVASYPDVAALRGRNPTTTAFIERYRDRHPGASPRWRWVPYGRISPHLKRAVLVGEDIDFFTHRGFEVREIRRALADAWRERHLPRGASTLTQQLAKNLWLAPGWNPLRKLREAILTWDLERSLDKRRILELYLNVVEFGPGIYGAEAAARHYFGKPAAELEPLEAAQLAAALPKPSAWHPGSASRVYQQRVRSVSRRMDKAAFLWRQI
jgi:monofunctional biosynthetic peptidoglycan transglycosylase